MAEIIIGAKVINKLKQVGTIVSVENTYIVVDFGNRTAKLQLNAFEQGFLKYVNIDLQETVDEEIQQIKNEKDKEAEKKRLVDEQVQKVRRMIEAQTPVGTKVNSVSLRFEPAPLTLASVKKKHRDKVQDIFGKCDNDLGFFYDSFHPTMKYITPRAAPVRTYGYFDFVHEPKEAPPTYFRSRYSVGFLAKYDDIYVLRVFSRNDLYTSGMYGGFTVSNSDITEIIRIVCIDGEIYYFSKNLSCENGKYKNSTLYKRWQASTYVDLVDLDEVIKICDCNYLNNYIDTKNVNCLAYVKLLMTALNNNKAEIVFKNRLFSSVADIDNISDYLKEFSSKQIDFASKNKIIHTLPFIKRFGLVDLDMLRNIETIMTRRRNVPSIYDNIVQLFERHNFDLSILDEKLIGFLKNALNFNGAIYRDYLNEIAPNPGISIKDVFDRDYANRHLEMMVDRDVYYSSRTSDQYVAVARELSWIDREENGYYIIIPKNIPEFKYEAQLQSNCVYGMEYFLQVIDRQSIIVFLRKQKDIPFVTIEFDYETFDVLQAYRKYNQNVDDKLYQYIVDLGKQLKLEMMSQE